VIFNGDSMIAKVRSQNEILKRQVKDLNNKLNVALVSTTAIKLKPKPELNQNLGEDVLKKQLQNAYKQVEHYKKQLQWFTTNPDGLDYYEKFEYYCRLLLNCGEGSRDWKMLWQRKPPN